jgi:hypothetical protein
VRLIFAGEPVGPSTVFEESHTLNSKSTLSILAAVSALFLSLAAAGQAVPAADTASPEPVARAVRYEGFIGYGYTSLNQVSGSRNGLQGINASVTRDWGKFFGLTADGGYYRYAYDTTNPGANSIAATPTVTLVLLGPVVHADLFGHVSGFVHLLLGGEHTGGEFEVPNIALAGGLGGGLDYQLRPHLFLRASGDDIEAAFAQDPNGENNSQHKHRNSRASFGLVYKF